MVEGVQQGPVLVGTFFTFTPMISSSLEAGSYDNAAALQWGPCSAQCAQLFCLYHEVRLRQNKGKGCRLMKRLPKGCMPIDPYRYMDNIVGVICGSVSLSRIQKALHAVYGLELQKEGEGSVLPSLEAILSLDTVNGSLGLRLKPKVDYTLPPHKQLSRFPDRVALQSQRSAKSIAVQLGMKSSDYSSSLDDIQCNLSACIQEFEVKCYPGSWWRAPLLMGVTRSGRCHKSDILRVLYPPFIAPTD